VLILVGDSVCCSGCVDNVIDHPDGGEEDKNDEESLQVKGADFNSAGGAATDQSTAKDQDVQTDDPRQHPSPVSAPVLHNLSGGHVQLGFTCALRLIPCADVGEVRIFHLPVFGSHLAWLTQTAAGQAFARIVRVITHGSSL